MLARLANAKARLRFQETLSGLSPDADIRALESVREHINRLVDRDASSTATLGDGELEQRLERIREAEADAARARAARRDEARAERQPGAHGGAAGAGRHGAGRCPQRIAALTASRLHS